MFSFLAGLAVGALVGWQLPQPAWVTPLIEKIRNTIENWFTKQP